MKKQAIFTIGISCAGKSIWAEEFVKSNPDYVIIERDKIRKSILIDKGLYKEGFLWKLWNFKNEKEVDVIVDEQIQDAVKNNKNIIFSNTNLNKKYLDRNILKMFDLGYNCEAKYMSVDFEEAVERDKKRAETVGIDIIEKQWFDWLKLPRQYTGVNLYVKNESLPLAVVSDIDGTVAHMFDRNPYDYHKAIFDKPDAVVLTLLEKYRQSGSTIIFLSGRDDSCKDVTVKWLDKHFGGEYLLYMRHNEDKRKDRVVKEELFFEHIANNYNVEFVIDDRKQVVRLWTDIGVKLLNVGNYYETF